MRGRANPPIFILGSPRSFSSLACAMLGQHPALYGLPELNLWVSETLGDFWERMAGHRQIQLHGLLRTVAHLYGGEQTLQGIELARHWVARRLDLTTAEIYRELCDRLAPLCPVDKSPVYGDDPAYLRRLHEAFPKARFIHLLRHPLDQGTSMLNIANGAMVRYSRSWDFSVDPPLADPQVSWLRVQRNITDFLGHLPSAQWRRIRGEDWLNDPQAILTDLCQWLGIDDGPLALAAMLHPENSPFASLGPCGAHLGNDINFLKSPALRPARIRTGSLSGPLPWRPDGAGFHREVRELATAFGYS